VETRIQIPTFFASETVADKGFILAKIVVNLITHCKKKVAANKDFF
jgi:hypothetical protein